MSSDNKEQRKVKGPPVKDLKLPPPPTSSDVHEPLPKNGQNPYAHMLVAFLQCLYGLEAVEYCYLTFEVSLFGFAIVHLLIQEYNLHKTNLYAWEYTGLCISIMALMRRLLLKVVQSAKMHQDAQEELWVRRVMDAQAGPLPSSPHPPGGVELLTPNPKMGKGDKRNVPKSMEKQAPEMEKAPAVPQIRALTQRRQLMESKSRRRLLWMGVALLGIHCVGALCAASLLFYQTGPAATATLAPAAVYMLFMRRAHSWGETTPASPGTIPVLDMVVRRHLVCTVYTAMAVTFHVAILPVILVSPHGYYSQRRCDYTAVCVFVNTLVLLLAQGLYKGVPMYATARMHDTFTNHKTPQEAGCAIHPDAPPPVPHTLIIRYMCARPDGVQRVLVVTQLALIAIQTYVCLHSVSWDTHLVMLLGSYVVLHHCQQCRHDLISSPIMNALLNHTVYESTSFSVGGGGLANVKHATT